jgi:cell shape-determining protein MreC
MKHFLLILFCGILGKRITLVLFLKLQMIIQLLLFIQVFCVFKTLSSEEHTNINEVSYNFGSVKGLNEKNIELREALEKIKQLEQRISQLEELNIPKKYENVKFLNYQNRKRILITGGAG